jgi:beta-glucanase (GH16 family)
MKHSFSITKTGILLIVIICALCWSCSLNTKKGNSELELVWADEFDYNGLPDSLKWSYDTVGNAWGWGNRELQYYTVARPENVQVSNGTLKIFALKEDYEGFNYTSARLITKEKGDWLYGRFEISAKLPDGVGLWPAIWMLPTDWEYGGWPASGELDIMENVGFDPFNIIASVHTTRYNHKNNTQRKSTIEEKNNRDQFNVYALEWKANKVQMFLNDSLYFTFEKEADDFNVWPFDKRFHLLLNLAVGGDWGGIHGVDNNVFPATFEIDYVRVYRFKLKE